MTVIRCFIAVPVKGMHDIEKLADEVGKIRGIKGVRTENIHLTLKFLGNIDEGKDIPQINDLLTAISHQHSPFTISFKGTGAFPNPNRMKVAWIGMDSPELVDLAGSINNALPPGKNERSQPFKPHLTIGRVKFGDGISRCRQLLEQYQDHDFGRLDVDEFLLIQSTLTPKGPIYKVLERFALTGK